MKNLTHNFVGISRLVSGTGATVWKAQLFRAGKLYYLGSYATDRSAAWAYDLGARATKAWSLKNTRLNFPDGHPDQLDKGESETATQQIITMVDNLRLRHPEMERLNAMAIPVGASSEVAGSSEEDRIGFFLASGKELHKAYEADQVARGQLIRVVRELRLQIQDQEKTIADQRARLAYSDREIQNLRPQPVIKLVTPQMVAMPVPEPGSAVAADLTNPQPAGTVGGEVAHD